VKIYSALFKSLYQILN